MAVEESIEREYYRVSDQLLYERANIEEMQEEGAPAKHASRSHLSFLTPRPWIWSPDGRYISYYAFNAKKGKGENWIVPLFGDLKPVRSRLCFAI